MNNLKKIYLLHCFPAPYRNHLFKAMNQEASKRGIKFIVQFYAEYDESRPSWRFKSEDLEYEHHFWKLNYKRGPVLHYNRSLLKHIERENPDLIITGGVWSSINSILLITFSCLPIIGWDETNRYDFGSVEKNYVLLKRFLVNRLKYLAVPGLESVMFYKELLSEKDFRKKCFLNLPNLVDETLFEKNSDDLPSHKMELLKSLGIPESKKIIYWPARFIKAKGIENFIRHLNIKNVEDWIIIISGHGPLRNNIQKLIDGKKLGNSILLLDFMPYNEAIKFYHIADLLIMPSLSDPNPLSLIEGIHASLPLLISNRVGNLHEVLVEGENGLSINPYDTESINYGINNMFTKTKDELKQMGLKSKKIAIKNFSTHNVIKQFFDDIEYKYKIL